ncbi:MAG: hypothetical protein HY518_00590 [Candidatus Aenigmarchaeota archaeon]|nr:hypothetical protein [Candidatus Aenigmarchaeota archaeon]
MHNGVNYTNAKAQATVEFLAIFIILLAAITVAAIISLQKTQLAYEDQTEIEASKLLNSIVTKINSAHIVGDGFSINITLPQDMFTYNYTVTFDSNNVIIQVNGAAYLAALLTSNITGTLGPGVSTISNVNGGIVIS